jgi:hypothetical protein
MEKGRGAQILGVRVPWLLTLFTIAFNICGSSVFYPSGFYSFEVAPRILEILCTSGESYSDFFENIYLNDD